ncbi:EF-hand-containing protein [Dioscorea alata]|uniref:EF-hand-containing protein n=1 Tax=Dioscorea alata TaxID=55571 RepID=A0ACB7V1A2_DIOAL|nr:EF-hand-containing protein [Dioscorea alata]
MGQGMNKLTSRKSDVPNDKNGLNKLIEGEINEYFKNEVIIDNDGHTHFCHIVYEIIEKISKKSGAMLFELPEKEKLSAAYKKFHANSGSVLTKKEFRDILTEVIEMDSVHVGQSAKTIFLAIFGAPVIALLAKGLLPGPISYISDEVIVPVATSCTVLLLAKTNRL